MSPASANRKNTTQTGGVLFGYGARDRRGRRKLKTSAKKCPVDTVLARGRVHEWPAASGRDVDGHSFGRAPQQGVGSRMPSTTIKTPDFDKKSGVFLTF